jgi:hypothetical protein
MRVSTRGSSGSAVGLMSKTETSIGEFGLDVFYGLIAAFFGTLL